IVTVRAALSTAIHPGAALCAKATRARALPMISPAASAAIVRNLTLARSSGRGYVATGWPPAKPNHGVSEHGGILDAGADRGGGGGQPPGGFPPRPRPPPPLQP